MKSAIVVDSTATLSHELANHPHIYQIHLTVQFDNGESFVDSPDPKKNKDFYRQLAETDHIPTTSQPAPADYISLYQELIDKDYEDIYFITLSSQISGCFQTAKTLAQDFQDQLHIHLIDSKGTSFLIENMVCQALNLIDLGFSSDQIVEKLNWVADHSVIYAAIEDLSYIQKGGRISGGTAKVGNLLKIKPIIYFNDEGAVEIYGTVRTSKRIKSLFKKLVDQAVDQADYAIDLAFAHADCEEEIVDIKEAIESSYPDLNYRWGFLTSILAVHGGPACKGMGIIAQASIEK